LPDAARGMLAALPSLHTQEAIVFGEGVPLPIRIHFDDLSPVQRRVAAMQRSRRHGRPIPQALAFSRGHPPLATTEPHSYQGVIDPLLRRARDHAPDGTSKVTVWR